MEHSYQARPTHEAATPTAAKPRSPSQDSSKAEQSLPPLHDFSHVDLFTHAPKRTPIQMKFTVGEPSDRIEQKALLALRL